MSFAEFELDARLARAVEELGFIAPTPVQEKAIPPALAGRDLIGLAQTGTGKSAAFILPILQRLLGRERGHTRALIVAPTRELTEQLSEHVAALGVHTDLRCATVYGGVKYKAQIDALHKGVEVVVATPGRLLDLIERGSAKLGELDVFVLDEADRMLDMGFLPDIKRILRKLPRGRQTMMFSATMPYDIRRLCTEIMQDPVTIEIGLRAPVETVSHALYAVAPAHKNALLLAILRQTDTESVLVFTQMKSAARAVYLALRKEKFKVAVIEGDMPQGERQEALDGFRAGKTQVLVATDIAARGLDISQVSHVINFDMPESVDDYTHRIGRTGRALHTGDAFTFVTHEDLEMVVRIEKVLGMSLEYKHVTGLPFPPPPWDPLGRPATPEKRDRRRPTRPSLRRGRR